LLLVSAPPTNSLYNWSSFNNNNRIASTTVNSATFTYDLAGNVTNDGTNHYVYDPGGRICAVWSPGPVYTQYVYDASGKRIARIDPGATTAKYYVQDNVGSTALVTDYLGNPLSESLFFPYGGEQAILSNDTNTYKFTGKQRDPETGLDDFGARYYASNLGRFMSPDWAAKPVTVPYASFGDPQTLNLYSYVENGPLNRVDADGHAASQGGDNNWSGMALTSDMDWIPLSELAGSGAKNPNEGGMSLSSEAQDEAAYDAMVQASQQGASQSQSNAPVAQAQQSSPTDNAAIKPSTFQLDNSIVSASYTSAAPGMYLGGMVGEAIEPLGGGVLGAILGSTVGVGPSASYVPSTDSTYLGPTLSFTPRFMGGEGFNASWVFAPKQFDANNIAGGWSYSVSSQPWYAGATATYSPGNGWAAGPSAGGRSPVSVSVSYSFDVSAITRPVENWLRNLFH